MDWSSSGQGYSVALPENLQSRNWNGYRLARLPMKLVSWFEDHPEIGTLHDNFVHADANFQDYKYLAIQIRLDGTVRAYKWMTYGEAGTTCSAIGSGLKYNGIPMGSSIGLYFINRPKWLIVDHACSAYSYISIPLYDTLGPDDVTFVANRSLTEAMLTHGNLIANAADGFLGGNLKLMDDMGALRPTVFCNVPRLYLQQNLEDKIFVYGDDNVMVIKSFDQDDPSGGSDNKGLWDGY
ncbi:hypothetical protein NE237_021214 [Protea cynaroides]|uniref:AMP-dependent synthetase/ligase domain-containing protein n=1 Tax=Protea cynaroides TaxID=273540 RepID=A0A9Q0H8P7_9MAGN|nr:hypothetical protein NE237_021214 [Protea cynaroides]